MLPLLPADFDTPLFIDIIPPLDSILELADTITCPGDWEIESPVVIAIEVDTASMARPVEY
jgi:hypothetical protein